MRHVPRLTALLATAALTAASAAAVLALPAVGARGGRVSATTLALRRATAALHLAQSANRRALAAQATARRALLAHGRGFNGPAGPRGRTGSRGATGPRGPAGPAGLSASSFASVSGGSGALGVTGSPGTPQAVFDLGSGANGGAVRLGAGANLLAHATVLLHSGESTVTGEARCGLQVSDPSAGFVAMGQESATTIAPGATAELALTGTLGRPAGSWDVRVVCRQIGSGAIVFVQGDLQVVAAA